jgi:hypothetical protein
MEEGERIQIRACMYQAKPGFWEERVPTGGVAKGRLHRHTHPSFWRARPGRAADASSTVTSRGDVLGERHTSVASKGSF